MAWPTAFVLITLIVSITMLLNSLIYKDKPISPICDKCGKELDRHHFGIDNDY